MELDSEHDFLALFAGWLRALGADTGALYEVHRQPGLARPFREACVGAANHVFKLRELAPPGAEDLGALDGAYMLRVAAALILDLDSGAAGLADQPVVQHLAAEARLLREFSGELYPLLEAYAAELPYTVAAGRTVTDILDNEAVGSAFEAQLAEFAEHYLPPTFAEESKNLARIRAYLAARLPR